MATSSPLARTHVRPGVVAMGHWKSFAIYAWRARADAAAARDVVAFGDALIPRQPLFTPVHIVEATAGLPTSDGRDELLAPGRLQTDRVASVGVLLPEAHVTAAMMRVFMRSTRVIMREKVTFIVEPTVPKLVREMLAVHHRRGGEPIDAGELAAAIEAVRQLAAEHAAP